MAPLLIFHFMPERVSLKITHREAYYFSEFSMIISGRPWLVNTVKRAHPKLNIYNLSLSPGQVFWGQSWNDSSFWWYLAVMPDTCCSEGLVMTYFTIQNILNLVKPAFIGRGWRAISLKSNGAIEWAGINHCFWYQRYLPAHRMCFTVDVSSIGVKVDASILLHHNIELIGFIFHLKYFGQF